MHVKLGTLEILLYAVVWLGAVIYSSYHVYLAGKMFDHSVEGDDFSNGWYGFKKDTSDYEWGKWIPFIFYVLSPWIGAHILLTEVARFITPKSVPALNSFLTLSFLYVNFGGVFALFAIVHVSVYYCILKFKSVILMWLLGLPFLIFSSYALEEMWYFIGAAEDTFHMMIVSTTWTHLRCLSFCLDQLESPNPATLGVHTLYDLLGFSFYFPTYFLGPFIMYSSFGPYMYRPFQKWTWKRVNTFLWNMFRYLFWTAVTEATLYVLFIHALQFQMPGVLRLGEWTLYGLGYLLGQFFYMKYVTVYGLVGTIAKFDGYDPPPPPKCVGRIHLYTDMWRHFDVGYYRFIHKYIYKPLCGDRRDLTRRLLASAACFSYVFIWHGTYLAVFIWSLLNYLGVTIVTLATNFSNTPAYMNWERQTLSETNSRRLKAVLSTPIFIMGPTSSFYFFSEMTTANTFVNHLLFYGSWSGLITLFFVSYCMCQVSIEAKHWEERRAKKMKSN